MTPTLSGAELLALVCAGLVALTLAYSGVAHMTSGGLGKSLREQRLIPQPLIGLLSTVIPIAEFSIALLLAAGILGVAGRGVQVAGAAAAASLFLTYAAYQAIAVRTRPGTPCGCSGRSDVAVSAATVFRAAFLAFGSVGAAALALPAEIGPFDAVAATIGAVVLAVVNWLLPGAVAIAIAPAVLGTNGTSAREEPA